MQYVEEFLTAPDGHDIPVRMWRPNRVDKVLVIAHGMAEYCERYAPMADWLVDSDVAVVALNHRGHGMDCPEDDLGYFADSRGWEKAVDDLQQTIEWTTQQLPAAPVTLLGHSMGSFMAQAYLQRYPGTVNQVILMSTNRINRPLLSAARLLVKLIKLFRGPKVTSATIEFLSFGSFNKAFRPNRTEFDWLSRDNEQVDAYVDDPYCGFRCTTQMWSDFLDGMLAIDYRKWPQDLPIHLLSGSADPVGEQGKGIRRMVTEMTQAGCVPTTFKLYDEARHELINEINAEAVWEDIRSLVLQGGLTAETSQDK